MCLFRTKSTLVFSLPLSSFSFAVSLFSILLLWTRRPMTTTTDRRRKRCILDPCLSIYRSIGPESMVCMCGTLSLSLSRLFGQRKKKKKKQKSKVVNFYHSFIFITKTRLFKKESRLCHLSLSTRIISPWWDKSTLFERRRTTTQTTTHATEKKRRLRKRGKRICFDFKIFKYTHTQRVSAQTTPHAHAHAHVHETEQQE